MKNCVLGVLFLIGFQSFAQDKNYVDYYEYVNQAEEAFVNKMDASCFNYYDKAFGTGVKPFLKDPYIAAQIALYLNDTVRFNHYLGIAFENGMPLKSVTASKFVQDRYYPHLYKGILATYKRTYVKPRIDSVLLGEICMMCYRSDSLKLKTGGRSQDFYNSENESRGYIQEYLLSKGIFANEHLLGITTNEMWEDFYRKYNRKDLYGPSNGNYSEECELRLKCPMNILLHSQCFFQENKAALFKAMENGYLHPKDYAILEETSVLWFKDETGNDKETCKRPEQIISYNIYATDPTRIVQTYDASPEGMKRAESNRRKIHLQKFSVDQRKKELEGKYGFAFFFDFHDRP
jgi:hypothetical protein